MSEIFDFTSLSMAAKRVRVSGDRDSIREVGALAPVPLLAVQSSSQEIIMK